MFIFRADVVREIFFHFTDITNGDSVDLGDDVEFTIQTRNGKEVACDIVKLPAGTVVFEDVGTEPFRGQVLKPLDRKFNGSDGDALNGRVKYRGVDRSEMEVPFGEKDQVGDFTLKHGDWVQFVIAVDRRDKLQRATKIELLDESFKVSDERRETGTISSLKDGGFGFIRCADRYAQMFFHFSECLDVSRGLTEGDEVEFTVATDVNQGSKLMATRIKFLPKGSVQFDAIIHKDVTGRVEVEPGSSGGSGSSNSSDKDITAAKGDSASNSSSEDEGLPKSPPKEGVGKILYELNGLSLEIKVHANDCSLREFPHQGDVVKFDINQLKSTKETNAVNIRILETTHKKPAAALVVDGTPQQGYIAAIKDG